MVEMVYDAVLGDGGGMTPFCLLGSAVAAWIWFVNGGGWGALDIVTNLLSENLQFDLVWLSGVWDFFESGDAVESKWHSLQSKMQGRDPVFRPVRIVAPVTNFGFWGSSWIDAAAVWSDSGDGVADMPVENRDVAAAVFGEHVSLSLEATSALQAFVSNVGFRFVFRGHFAYCNLPVFRQYQDCEDPLCTVLQVYLDPQRQNIDPHATTKLGAALMEVFHQEPLAVVDLVVVTRPYLLSWLLELAAPLDVPILSVQACPHLLGVPPALEEPFAGFLSALVSKTLHGRRHVVADINPAYCAAMAVEFIGVPIPRVPNACKYLPGGTRYTPETDSPVLFYMTQWLQNSAGRTLVHILKDWAPCDAFGFTCRLTSQFQSYEQLSRFKSIVLLPENMSKRIFWELYHMGVPIFMPTRSTVARIFLELHDFNDAKFEFQPSGVMPVNESHPGSAVLLPHCSGLRFGSRGPASAVARLYDLSDYNMYPGVSKWGSFAELAILARSDLVPVVETMAAFSAREIAVAEQFYRRSFAELLG